jgi:hypothetical protein
MFFSSSMIAGRFHTAPPRLPINAALMTILRVRVYPFVQFI